MSVEPMLGAVNITDRSWWDWRYTYDYYKIAYPNAGPPLDWLICGGESGPGARPMHPDWARLLRDQCQVAGMPFFFKSWGAWKEIQFDKRGHGDALVSPRYGIIDKLPDPFSDADSKVEYARVVAMRNVGKRNAGRLLDGRTWSEFPEEAQREI